MAKWCAASARAAPGPSALNIACSLLYGDGDFTKSVCLAVMTGYDDDGNAGTVGAVLGGSG